MCGALKLLPVAYAILGNEAYEVELVSSKLNRAVLAAPPKKGFSPGTLTPPAPVIEKPIPLAKIEEVEQLTKENFVRQCTVVLGVNDKDLLPTAPLEKLCQTTEHVAECREVIVGRLKQAHGRGDPLDVFCDSAYEWFQNKYGHLCANQCDKLQCKASCAWLARKKDFEAQKETFESLEGEAKADKTELKEMKNTLDELEDASKQSEREVERYKVKVERSQKYLSEAEKVFNDAHAETLKTNLKVDTQEKDLKDNIAKMSKLEDAISKQAHKVNMGELEQKELKRKVEDVEKDLFFAENKKKDALESLKAFDADIAKKKDSIEQGKSKLRDEAKKIVKIQKKFRAFLPKVRAERNKYKDLKRKGASEDELKQQASVYKQVKQKLKDIRAEKKPFKDEINRLRTEVKQVRKLKADEVKEREKLKAELTNMDGSIADTKTKLDKANADLQSHLENLDKGKTTLANLKKEMSERTEKQKKQEITLKFTTEANEEDKKVESGAASTVEAKKTDFKNMQQGSMDADAASTEAKSAEEKQAKALKDAQTEFEKNNKEMLKMENELKTYRTKLRKSTPDIVAQHKLGLIRQNATTTTSTTSTASKVAAHQSLVAKKVAAHHHHHHHHHHHKHQQQHSKNVGVVPKITTTIVSVSTTTSTTKVVATNAAAHSHHHHHHHKQHQKTKKGGDSTHQPESENGGSFTQVHVAGGLRFRTTNAMDYNLYGGPDKQLGR